MTSGVDDQLYYIHTIIPILNPKMPHFTVCGVQATHIICIIYTLISHTYHTHTHTIK